MRKELDEKLVAKYPKIFADRNGKPSETAMCYGFACGDGWFTLIDVLCGMIQQHIDDPPRLQDPATKLWTIKQEIPQVVAFQVKEKFGGLRFYIGSAPDRVHRYIEFAEAMSYHTCEECGTTVGVTTEGNWVRSLCSACRTAKAGSLNEN